MPYCSNNDKFNVKGCGQYDFTLCNDLVEKNCVVGDSSMISGWVLVGLLVAISGY